VVKFPCNVRLGPQAKRMWTQMNQPTTGAGSAQDGLAQDGLTLAEQF
jgi:hypothetical protein